MQVNRPRSMVVLLNLLLLPMLGCAVLYRGRVAPSVYPVTKVVELLRHMQTQLQQEADSDEAVYEKLACWCETNDKGKTKAITDAQARLVNIQGSIEKFAALSATLKVEIEGLEKEIASNQKSLEGATVLRTKQKADFIEDEKEMVQSIRALDAAITVLTKHHGGGDATALLGNPAVSAALTTIKTELQKQGPRLQGSISPRQRQAIAAFVQGSGSKDPDYFGKTPTFKQAYAPQSGEVFGIVRQMKATFESDLSQSQQEEVAAQQVYDGLKSAKEQEIVTGQASHQDKKEQVAKSDESLVQARGDQEDTRNSLNADQQFLTELKLKCALTDKEWEERQKVRQAEITAVAEAISLLATDDARDLFSRTLNPSKAAASLLQVAAQAADEGSAEGRRARAAQTLAAAAARTHNPKMTLLASAAKLDSFTRVKRAIDDMVVALLEEKEEEIRHRDFCVKELNTNQKSTARELHVKKNLESKIAGLELKVKGLENILSTLAGEIGEINLARQSAKENRELEKKEFDIMIADQQEAESLLKQVQHVLKLQYEAAEKQLPSSPDLLQEAHRGAGASSEREQKQKKEQVPPSDFKAYERNGQSPGVLALLQHIIEHSQQLQQDATKAEGAARDSYTVFVGECTRSVEAKNAAIIDRSSEKAEAEQDLLQAKSELTGSSDELQTLSQGLVDLHGSCDYSIKNFDLRQEARDQEVEALRQAKAFLSGME